MRATVARRVLRTAFVIALAVGAAALLMIVRTRGGDPSTTAASTDKRTELVKRGVPRPTAARYSEEQLDLALRFVALDLEPEVAILRIELDTLDVPESSACALARQSMRAETDKEFARDVEKICVAWRKVMWDYAQAHAAEVESGDPVAIERVRNAFAMLDAGLMQELLKAGGIEYAAASVRAAPDKPPAPPRPQFEPKPGNETKEDL